jgi:hypothetical protein
MSELIPIRLDW